MVRPKPRRGEQPHRRQYKKQFDVYITNPRRQPPFHHHFSHDRKRAASDLAKRWPDGKGGVSKLYWRFCDLIKVVKVDYGGAVPHNDDGLDILDALTDTFWFGCAEPVLEIQRVFHRIAPWADTDSLIDDVADRAKRCIAFVIASIWRYFMERGSTWRSP